MGHIEIDHIFDLCGARSPKLDPSGRHVAFEKWEVDKGRNCYTSNIWLMDLETRECRKFTCGDGVSESGIRWSPDGKSFAFVSNRVNSKSQIFRIRLEGGEAEQLTFRWTGAASPAFSPDGTKLAFCSASTEEERAEEDEKGEYWHPLAKDKYDKQAEKRKKAKQEAEDPRHIDRMIYRSGTSYHDNRYQHIYVLDLTAQSVKRVTDGQFNHSTPVWQNDHQIICDSKRTEPTDQNAEYDLLRVNIESREEEQLWRGNSYSPNAVISPNRSCVVFQTIRGDRSLSAENQEIQMIDLSSRDLKLLPTDFDGFVYSCDFIDDGRISFISGQHGRTKVFMMELASGSTKPWVAFDGGIVSMDSSLGGRNIGIQTTPDYPGELALINDNGSTDVLTSFWQDRVGPEVSALPYKEMWWQAPDGTKVQGWVIEPPGYEEGDTNKSYPLILQVHGGPHVMWGYDGGAINHEFQCMASQGYFVLFSNPRGSDGYGEDFRCGAIDKWGEADIGDLMSGVDLVIDKYPIDTERLYLTGGSYGGYMTAWVVAHDKRFRAAVAQRGVFDLINFWGTSDAYLLTEWEFSGLPWENTEHYLKYSPWTHADKIETPLMILHSDCDYRAPVSSAEMMYAAMKRIGKTDVVMVRFPEEGHELSRGGKPKRRVKRIKVMLEWFAKYGGIELPPEEEEGGEEQNES